MAILDKLLRRAPKDPYWEFFINGEPGDARNETSQAYRTAEAGDVFPVKTEIPEPSRMAHDLAEFAVFMGGATFAVAASDGAVVQPFDGQSVAVDELPFTLLIAVPAEADPATSPGIGGQHARRVSAMVNHSVASYIRELGFQASVCPVSVDVVATASRLERPAKTYVGDAILTDIPVALGPQTLEPGRKGA
jgi:hypothetical protein